MWRIVSSANPRVAAGSRTPRPSPARTALLWQAPIRAWALSSRISWISEGVSADAIACAARVRAISSWERRSSRSRSWARSVARRRASASASRAGVTSWSMSTRPTIAPLASRTGDDEYSMARPSTVSRSSIASSFGSAWIWWARAPNSSGLVKRHFRTSSITTRIGRPTIGARSIPSSEPTAPFASDRRPRPSLDDHPEPARGDNALQGLAVPAAAGRELGIAGGQRDLRRQVGQLRDGRLGDRAVPRQADQRDRAEGGRVARAHGDGDGAGVEHQPVQGPRRPALVGQRREAVDLGRLGDQARPRHRLAGPAGGVADADGVEALRRQERRERLRAGRGADAVAVGDGIAVGLVDHVDGDDVHREHLVDALGDLVERRRQLGGGDGGEAGRPARRVDGPARAVLNPAGHRAPRSSRRSGRRPPRSGRAPAASSRGRPSRGCRAPGGPRGSRRPPGPRRPRR